MKNKMKKIVKLLFLVSISLALTSCASTMNYDEPLSLYANGNPKGALASLQSNEESYLKSDGSIVYSLNVAMVAHSANSPEESNSYFDTAENNIAQSYTKSVSKNAASYIISENTRDYSSPNYEDIYTNLFKSLNYYKIGNTEEAMVEIRRMNEKIQNFQNETPLKEDSRVKYDSFEYNKTNYPPLTNSGLAQYLSLLFSYEYGDDNYFDVSLKLIDNALQTEGMFYKKEQYNTIDTLKTLDCNKTIVSFLSFSGMAPKKVQKASNNVLLQKSYTTPGGTFYDPLYKDIIYSVPMIRPSLIKTVVVNVDGENYKMEEFENIGDIAFSSMVKKSKAEYARAFIRVLTREISKTVVSETADNQDEKDFACIFSMGMNLFTAVSEQADVRCSLFFPSQSWISCLEIEPGIHDITVKYLDCNCNIIDSKTFEQYEVVKGKANLIETISPK